MISSEAILNVLDLCSEACTFPMMDNGYLYLAATRLSLHRSRTEWALVIEQFGFSPRAGYPDVTVQTFASRLHDRDPAENYVSRAAYEDYLANNPHNELRSFFPFDDQTWQDEEEAEFVAADATTIMVRGHPVAPPRTDEYARLGIGLEQAPRVQVFELCRFLADRERDRVLATPQERRVSVPPDMQQILQLEEWRHPDLLAAERPSESEAFRQLATVLATGEIRHYRPSQPPNTHWRNWPEGGRL